MIRLRVREFVAENAPGLNRYELARRANLSYKFVDKIWREPANTHIYFDGLAAIAEALSQYLQRKVHLSELFEDDTENR
jgi:hypothetical protein